MKEQLISFETAKLAKEKYFNIDTYYAYSKYGSDDYKIKIYHSNVYQGADPVYLAPSQSLLQKYLREEYGIHVEINLNFIPSAKEDFGFGISVMTNIKDPDELRWLGLDITGIWYKTYEEALEAGLFESLKLI